MAKSCAKDNKRHEFRFQEVQCYEALKELQAHLHLRTHMNKYKDQNIVGQSANTHCQNLLKRAMRQVDMSAEKYRQGRQAVVKLSEVLREVVEAYCLWKTQIFVLLEISMVLIWIGGRK